MSDPNLPTRPQFPRINKHVRLIRRAHEHYMRVRGQSRFPALPYWKMLKPGKAVFPVPVEPNRAPTKPVIEAYAYPPGQVPLGDQARLTDYPQPPDELSVEPSEMTVVDAFGEAEWDKKKFKAFLCPAFVKYQHSATLTKFGKVVKTEGEIHISRFVLESIGLEPDSGDLFQWEGKLRVVVDAINRYGYIGTSDYWTWIKCPYVDFWGDSSDLTLPDIPDIEPPSLVDEQ